MFSKVFDLSYLFYYRKYNAGDTLNINVLFKKLEKNASMGRMFLEDIELVLARIRETREINYYF